MKLAERSFMNETRYSQSFGDFSQRKNKLLSTGFTNNTMNTTMRLPKLTRSLSSSSSKSAKLRVDVIDQNIKQISSKLSNLRTDTRESRRYVNFLKQDLAQRQLTEHKNLLTTQIKKLENAFKFSRKQNEDRSAALKYDCKDLNTSSKQLISMLDSLKERVDRLQDTMGIYSGKQKHKF